jgi:YgiT-type zinc finger domain-containing protein
MGTRLEKAKTKKTAVKRCMQGCPGQPRPETITRVFQRTGSLVEVILENIPAEVCPICGRAFFAREIVQGIDRILLPFHGKHDAIPNLPPAKVFVDFAAAQRQQAA